MVDERVRHVAIGADVDRVNVSGVDVVLANEALHDGHRRMSQRAGREGLDGDAGRDKSPGISEVEGVGIEAAAGGMEEAVFGFENVVAGGPAEQGKIGSDNTGLGGMSGVKGLGHGAEVLAEARGLAGGNA